MTFMQLFARMMSLKTLREISVLVYNTLAFLTFNI